MSKASDIYSLFGNGIQALLAAPQVYIRTTEIDPSKLDFATGVAFAFAGVAYSCLYGPLDRGEISKEEFDKIMDMIVRTLKDGDNSIINNWYEQEEKELVN
jgi:hypothetical protein